MQKAKQLISENEEHIDKLLKMNREVRDIENTSTLSEQMQYTQYLDIERQDKYDQLYNKYNTLMEMFYELMKLANETDGLNRNPHYNNLLKRYREFAKDPNNTIASERSPSRTKQFKHNLKTPCSQYNYLYKN